MSAESTVDARLAEVVSDVQIPLDNLAYTIESYLMANGCRLDTETRFLLAGIRDCADLVADRVRRMARQTAPQTAPQTGRRRPRQHERRPAGRATPVDPANPIG